MIKKGIVLDVEAIRADWRFPEKSGIKCVTALDFDYDHKFLGGGKFLTFEEASLRLLQAKLSKHKGIIVGHNLFAYDYRVLSSRIKLNGIIEKSVDLSTWFEERIDPNSDLTFDLQGIIKLNLGRNRTRATRHVNKLWLAGGKRQVFDQNMVDCISLVELYGQMLFNRTINVPFKKRGFSETRFRCLHMNETDLDVLRGKHSYFSSKEWYKLIQAPANEYGWAHMLRSGQIGNCPNRVDFSYDALRCKDDKKAALFFILRNQGRRPDKKFRISREISDVLETELSAAAKPQFLGYCDAEGLLSAGVTHRKVFWERINRWGHPNDLPLPIKRHLKRIRKQFDDPNIYILHRDR